MSYYKRRKKRNMARLAVGGHVVVGERDLRARGDGKGRAKKVVAAGFGRGFYSPATVIGRSIAEAMDPRLAPAPVRGIEDMTPEEIEAIERQYGAKVRR